MNEEEFREEHAKLHKDDGCTLHGSKEKPIKVEEMRYDANQYIAWEYEMIRAELGRCRQRLLQSVVRHEGRLMDRIMVEAEDGSRHVFYFDVTTQYDASTKAAAVDTPASFPGAAQGRRTKHLVIWNPAYEAGLSRYPTIQALRTAWAAQAPWLLERRSIFTKDTANPELLAKCGEWLDQTWGKTLGTRKRLSVVIVTDPEWEREPLKFSKAIQALQAGYSAGGRQKPQTCIVGIESAEGV